MSQEIINSIQEHRTQNNENWMKLLRGAVKYFPKAEIIKILQGIIDRDMDVTLDMVKLLEELKK